MSYAEPTNEASAHLITTVTSSRLFTFGIVHASMTLLSLNHNLATIYDVDALRGVLYAAAVEVVDYQF